MNFLRVFIETTFDSVRRILQRTVGTRLFGFAIGVVKLVRQKRFDLVSLFDRFLDLLTKLFDLLLSFLDSVNKLLTLVVAVEPIVTLTVFVLVLVLQTFREFFLFLLKLLSFISHFSHLLIELTGGLFLEVVAKFFQFSFRPSPFGCRFRKVALLQRFRRSLYVFASLFDLFHLIGLLILRVFHPFLKFVGVAEHLLLLFFEPLQLFLQFFLLLFSFRFFESRLQFLDPFV